LAKIAAQVGPSALVHYVALAMILVYGELHFGKRHLYMKMLIQSLALTLFMVHNTLLIEKVISITFFNLQ
jgi:hypothetical protein